MNKYSRSIFKLLILKIKIRSNIHLFENTYSKEYKKLKCYGK